MGYKLGPESKTQERHEANGSAAAYRSRHPAIGLFFSHVQTETKGDDLGVQNEKLILRKRSQSRLQRAASSMLFVTMGAHERWIAWGSAAKCSAVSLDATQR
jgi:hypothetical protein